MSITTVGRDPVGRVMLFIHGVADTSMGSREDLVACDVEGEVHEFVHILEDYHVTVKLYNALVFYE